MEFCDLKLWKAFVKRFWVALCNTLLSPTISTTRLPLLIGIHKPKHGLCCGHNMLCYDKLWEFD